MRIVAFNVGLGEFLVKQFLVPVKLLRPALARRWLHSRLRSRYCAVSKASLCLFIAAVCNLLVILMCLPLLRVPIGSAIKPMGLVFFSLVFNVAAPALCQRIVQGGDRPQGSRVLLGVAMLLCLTPFLGGMFLMHVIAIIRNLAFG